MNHLLRKIFFWDEPAQGRSLEQILLMVLLTIGFGSSCVSTTEEIFDVNCN